MAGILHIWVLTGGFVIISHEIKEWALSIFFLSGSYVDPEIIVLHKTKISELMDDMEVLEHTIVCINIEIIQLVQQMNGCIDPFSEYVGSPLQDWLLQEKTAALQKALEQRVQYYTECRLRMELVDEMQPRAENRMAMDLIEKGYIILLSVSMLVQFCHFFL